MVIVSSMTPTKVRLAGILYLATIVAGVFAQVIVRGSLIVPGNPAATAANIAHHAAFYRLGEAADVAMLGCYLAVTVLFYELFAPLRRSLARLAALFSLTGIAVLAADGLLHLAPLALLDPASGGGLPAGSRDALIGTALRLHGAVYGLSLIFFGIYCLLIGYLAVLSGWFPRTIGLLMMIGGAGHLLTKFGGLLAPGFVHALPHIIDVLPLIGEVTLALWLTLFGLRVSVTPPPR